MTSITGESEEARVERSRKLVEAADRILGEKGDTDRVAELLIEAAGVDRQPLHPAHWTVVASHYLLSKERPHEALDAFRRALAADPGYLPAICPMLIAAEIVGEGHEAKRLLGRAWEALDPGERGLLVSWLRQIEPQFEKAARGHTLLFTLSLMGHEEIVRALLDGGADPGVRNSSDHNTPLHAAAAVGHDGLVRLLLERGADVEAVGEGGTTPLALAATFGEPSTAELLVKAGADVDRRDEKGSTPLFLAAGESRVAMVEALLRLGADPNATGTAGMTPLAGAILLPARPLESHQMVSTVLALLEGGADAKGATAASLAEKEGYEELAALIRGWPGSGERGRSAS